MTIRERILTIKIIEKTKDKPEQAKKLGITVVKNNSKEK